MKHGIEISVKRKADKHKQRKAASRPLIKTGGSPDVLSRRKHRGLQIYDLGQVLSGSVWVTNAFAVVPNLSLGGTLGGFRLADADVLTLSQIQGLEALIFSFPLSAFRKVLKSVRQAFPLQVTGDGFAFSSLDNDAAWTDAGLVLTNSQLHSPFLGIDGSGFGHTSLITGIEINDRASTKVTSSPAFGSADVPFTLSANASIYLMPKIHYHFGQDFTNDEPGPLIARTVIYNGIYRLRPRDFEHPSRVFEYYGGGALDTALFNEALANSSTLTPTRTTSLNVYGNGDPDDITPGGTFPTGDTINDFGQIIKFDVSANPVGQLLGIVKQSGSTYYFWRL